MHSADRKLRFLGLRPTGDLGGLTAYTSRTNKTVWFPKSPPTSAPTHRQLHCRNLFRLVAELWHWLTPDLRADWHTATRRAHLTITAYNLFTYWHATHDDPTLATLERIAGVDLRHPFD